MSTENNQLGQRLNETLEPVQELLVVYPYGLDKAIHYRIEAMTDPLTGLYNRRAFDMIAAQTFATQQRDGQTGVLLMIDLNKFKGINDNFGHDFGDRALKRVARVVVPAFRKGDVFARIGGDEFAAYLPSTEEAGGREVASKLLNLISDPTKRGTGVGASIGMEVTKQGDTLNDVIARADRAMYAAKDQSRATGESQLMLFSELAHPANH